MQPEQVWANAKTAVSNMSFFSNGLLAFVVALCLLSLIPGMYDYLAITPGSVIPPKTMVWTLVTGGFVESNLLLTIVDLLVLLATGKLYEPLWGSVEYAKFVLIVNAAACTATASTFLFLYTATARLSLLFFRFSGMCAVLSGFTVAFKQAFPQRTMHVGAIPVHSRFMPGLVLCLYGLLFVLGVFPLAHVLLAVYGTLASWTYLRFFQRRDGAVGDASDSFAFADMFPTPLQPIVTLIGNRLYALLVLVRLCPKHTRIVDLSASGSSVHLTMPANPVDAERRRQRALHDLDKRLQATPAKTSGVAAAAANAAAHAAATAEAAAASQASTVVNFDAGAAGEPAPATSSVITS